MTIQGRQRYSIDKENSKKIKKIAAFELTVAQGKHFT